MSRSRGMNRRSFVRRCAGTILGGGTPCIVPGAALGGDGQVAPSERVTVGCIGVGLKGTALLRSFLGMNAVRVVAVCDVNSHRSAMARRLVDNRNGDADCAVYGDFRALLARDDVDAVVIASPDHWHVPIATAAARAGKDMYLEKPIGVTMAEARSLVSAVRRYGRVFQFGTQQRSSDRFRRACEIVRNGLIGELKHVNVWSPGSRSVGSLEVTPPPEWLDYDMWLGPAPLVPHTKHRCTNRFRPGDPSKVWPFISDYCIGWISGWGVHPLDIALWGAPQALTGSFQIEGAGVFPSKGPCDTATNWRLALRYDTGVTLNFTGAPASPEWRRRYGRCEEHGTVFEGTEGRVHVDRERLNTFPKSLATAEIGADATHLYHSRSHVGNLIDCVKSRRETISSIDSAMAVETVCQASDIAARLRRSLKWDPARERFIGDADANRVLSRAMRAPWHL